MKTHWAVARGLNAEDREAIREACTRLYLPYSEFTLIPFSDELDDFGDAIYYGSTSILKHADKMGIFFDDDRFSMERITKEYREAMLNSPADFLKFSELKEFPISAPVFIKPVQCTKRFVGQVITPEELAEWSMPEDTESDWDGRVMISEAKNIGYEWRVWMVNGVAVAGSLYKVHGDLHTCGDPEFSVYKYCEEQDKRYRPADVYVMDICALTEEDRDKGGPYKIIEVNAFNSSGFYDANVRKIIESVSEFYSNAKN